MLSLSNGIIGFMGKLFTSPSVFITYNGTSIDAQSLKLPLWIQGLLFILSAVIVGFGQPAMVWWCGIIASALGFSLIFRVLLGIETLKKRFLVGFAWFAVVQSIQLYWMVSHPYSYIYGVLAFVITGMSAQFGLISLLITPFQLQRYSRLLVIAALWTIFEWSRLYFLTGFGWNPVGLSLSSTVFSRQGASIAGVYGLSFYVIFTNLLLVKAWVYPYQGSWHTSRVFNFAFWLFVAVLPYGYGVFKIESHKQGYALHTPKKDLHVVLIQTAFPPEEAIPFATPEHAIDYTVNEWKTILKMLKQHQGKKIDLIVMPEYIVPFGTFYPVFKHEDIYRIFKETYGENIVEQLPELKEYYHATMNTYKGPIKMVNNAFLVQAIADIYNADVIVGLEDKEIISKHEHRSYSSAFHFSPKQSNVERYEKRVLVPAGEYIPFDFIKSIARQYGITGSFTPGTEAKVMACTKLPVGTSICVEETYGHMMRENKLAGAELLANLTNDGWYPHSLLPRQHLEHARLRTVEMGIPLVRSCNTGVTCALDSFGRTVAVLGDEDADNEDISDALFAFVPTYHYETLYTHYGDFLILCLSFSILFVFGIARFARIM